MECIVHDDSLPRPWLNRLRNDELVAWVTHNGYLEVFLDDPAFNGLVNPQTSSGHFYLRDDDSGDSLLLNESSAHGDWTAVVGLGYNRIERTGLDLDARLDYFIPQDANVLIVRVTIVNQRDERRRVSVFGQVEWNLGDSVKGDVRPTDGFGGSQQNWYKNVWVEDDVMLAATKNWKTTHECIPWPYVGYFAMSEPVASFDAYAQDFHGVKRHWGRPASVERGSCRNAVFGGYDEFPYGVLHAKLTLQPRERREVVYLLGMEKEKSDVWKVCRKYSDPQAVAEALEQVRRTYSQFVRDTLTVKTPDADNDRLINIWSKYQWRQTIKKPPQSDHYVLGFWLYGMEGSSGERAINPECVLQGLDVELNEKSWIKTILERQARRGAVTASFQELGAGALDLHRHKMTHFTSTCLFHLLESGDASLLDKEVKFADGTRGTVWEHLRLGLDFFSSVVNERGLAKVPPGLGDWLDELTMLSKTGSAESVMEAAELAFALKEFALIAEKTGRRDDRDRWLQTYEKIKRGVNEHAWDGQWYARAFSDRTSPPQVVGSSANSEGQIYLNAQSWAILSGVAPPERAEQALDAVEQHLLSEYGPILFWPPYTKFVDYVGTQSVYSPGFRNGNVYLRPAGWAVMAAAQARRSDLANALYQSASLAVRSRDIMRYKLEPYAYPENYIGPAHPLGGEGQSHWCLGEGSAWMWYAYVSYILGVRAQWEGLLIDPQIPAEWSGYSVRRPFRGAVYEIEVSNPNHVASGVKWIEVDGVRIEGNLITPSQDQAIHRVKVMMQ